MARSVTIVAGNYNVELPNGQSYNALHPSVTNGPTIILTDEEGARLNPSSTAFVDNGTVGTNVTGLTQAANVTAPAAVTAVAVPTTAATNTTPYGYSQAQADDIRIAVNALVVDVTALQAKLTAEIAALKAGVSPLQKSS